MVNHHLVAVIVVEGYSHLRLMLVPDISDLKWSANLGLIGQGEPHLLDIEVHIIHVLFHFNH